MTDEPHDTPGTVDLRDTTLVRVPCARCGWVLGEASLTAGSVLRYRCKRCSEWTVVIVLDADSRPPELPRWKDDTLR